MLFGTVKQRKMFIFWKFLFIQFYTFAKKKKKIFAGAIWVEEPSESI